MPSLPLPVRPTSRPRTRPPSTGKPPAESVKPGPPAGVSRPRWAPRLPRALSPRAQLGLAVAVLLVIAAVTIWAALEFASGQDMRGLEQHQAGAATEALGSTTLVAQSFRFPRSGLSRVDVLVDSLQPSAQGEFRLVEGDGPGGGVIASVPLANADFSRDPYVSLAFPPVDASREVTYTLVLESPGQPLADSVSARYVPYDALSAGTLYTDKGTAQGDLAFAAYYRYTPATLLEDVFSVLSGDLFSVVAWALLFILPGLALLVWLPSGLTAGQRAIAAPGVTLLALPVFYLVTRAVGLPFGTVGVWLLLAASAGALAWSFVRQHRTSRARLSLAAPAVADILFWILLGIVFTATLAFRLVPLSEMSGGMGLDAYHHTLIARMFIEAGGVPANYLPYADLSSFTYHYGFHSFVATLAWLSGATSPNQLLVLLPEAGQLAGALPVLLLALLAWRFTGNRWAGLAAGAFAGLFSALPAYYVNWSRFTQGLGLALLPVALVFIVGLIDRPVTRGEDTAAGRGLLAAGQRSAPYLLAVITAAGLFLTHYRVAMLYGVFAVLFVGMRTVSSLMERKTAPETLSPVRRAGIFSGLLVAALSPWLVNLYSNFRTHLVGRTDDEIRAYYAVSDLWPLIGQPAFVALSGLAVAGLVLAWRRKLWLLWLLAITWAIAAVWSSPYLFEWAAPGFRLPFAGYLDSNTVAQSLWLPVSLLAGYAAAVAVEWLLQAGGALPRTWPRVWQVAATAILAVALVLVGLAVAAPVAARVDGKPYIAPADRAALEWMRANLPRNSVVAANPFAFPWSPQNVYGSDSGMWVPLMAGVRSTVPPLPAYNERLADPAYLENALQVVAFEPITGRTPDWDGIKRMGVTHIYAGTRGGAFDIPLLLGSPQVELVFHRDGVYLFRIR